MVVSPSAAVLLAAASLLLCSSASPIGPSTDIRTRREVSSRLVSPTRGSLAGADALEQLGRRQWFNPYAPLPDDYWNNPDILYFVQTPFELYENVRVLGPRQPQISPLLDLGNLLGNKTEASAPEGLVNTLGTGQDPSITSVMTEAGLVYYSTDSDYWTRIMMRSSNNLSDVNRARSYTSFTFDSIIITEAPDLARWVDDRWIYTISSVRFEQISSVVSNSNDPLGSWGSQGLVTYQGTPVKGFDSHIFTHPNGKRYIIWSDHATLVMAEMLTSTTVGKPSAVVSMMGDAKTKLNFWNTEAPTTVIAPNVNGSSTINLVFSTGDFRTPDYTTRVLTIDSSSDPMVARSWTLQRTPVLQTDAGRQVYGPGSVSFFDCEAGRKCIAYGAWAQANTVDEGGKRRSIRIQHVDFDASGKLQPMTPIIPTSFAE